MSRERIEAAAEAMEHHAGIFRVGHCADHHHEDSFECVARLAFEAADVVMTMDDLLNTRAGLALANAAFGEGLSAGVKACNDADDGRPFVQPVSPYSAPLLSLIKGAS